MKHRIRSAAIIVDNNKILLVKHVHPKTGFEWWVPPGGGVEMFDKSIFDCAEREVLEETNLKISISRVIYIREFFDRENEILNIELFMLADSFLGKVNIKNIEGKGPDELYTKGVKWLSREDFQDIEVYPEILKDDFWEDNRNKFPNMRYLGRQI